MQHPDEGMIHSWLDGALTAEDASRVESHVAGCAQCAAAVAEARGFIAASSRILTALDDVPRGVLPAAPTRKRDLRVFWRVAAAMLVVAGGSLIALREDGEEVRVPATVEDGVAVVSKESKAPAATSGAGSVEGAGATQNSRAPTPQSEEIVFSQRRAAAPPPARVRQAAPSAERDFSGKVGSGQTRGTAGSDVRQGTIADAAAPLTAAMNMPGYGARSEAAPLKVVRVERAIGGQRTIYEIAPSQTVTLTETESFKLSEIVTTGVAAANERQAKASGARSVAPMRTQAAAAPPAAPVADSPKATDSVTGSKVVATGVEASAALAGAPLRGPANTISWTETGTGKTLTLSGNLPVERLQEIRRLIERERAAADRKDP